MKKKVLKCFEIFWKGLLIKLKSSVRKVLFEKIEKDNQPNDWEAWLSDLIVEVLVVGKPEFPKNFSSGGERSNLKDIGIIFITLQLH
jgi:hypothetical protein